MSIMNCPECGRDVSTSATACPHCGRPLGAPAPSIQRKVVVTQTEPRSGFPNWLFVPIALLGILVVFLLVALFRSSDDESTRNVNVNLATQRTPVTRDTPVRTEPPNTVGIPPSTIATPETSMPQSVPQSTQTDVSTIQPDRGSVVIEAKVATRSGAPQPVRDEKFYLLDKDLDSILSEADIETIPGQTLLNSFGLSVVSPDKYPDINKRALAAINRHIKYNGLTGTTGQAQLKDVKPGSYYLFGITKTRSGFAIWNSPVTIQPGDNRLVLEPARLNEMSQ